MLRCEFDQRLMKRTAMKLIVVVCLQKLMFKLSCYKSKLSESVSVN